MRALALSAFVVGAAAVAGCRADYPPQSASIPQETAPATPGAPDRLAPAAPLPVGPAEATGPPINILKRPR